MILVDTNVISEAMRPAGSPAVIGWLDGQGSESLSLCAPVLAELLLGIRLLPQGKRREGLSRAVDHLVSTRFRSGILPYDADAATEYARLVSTARSSGQAIAVSDAQIAAIATAHGVPVATRDATPFLAAGLTVIDPWRHQS